MSLKLLICIWSCCISMSSSSIFLIIVKISFLTIKLKIILTVAMIIDTRIVPPKICVTKVLNWLKNTSSVMLSWNQSWKIWKALNNKFKMINKTPTVDNWYFSDGYLKQLNPWNVGKYFNKIYEFFNRESIRVYKSNLHGVSTDLFNSWKLNEEINE